MKTIYCLNLEMFSIYWHQSLSVSIPFLSPNACDWSIRQIHDHDWLRVMAGIQNVPKQNFQDSKRLTKLLIQKTYERRQELQT